VLPAAEHCASKTWHVELWSEEIGAYDHFDLGFAQLVAGQIAVAVEAQFHQQQLARERDRSRLLLEVKTRWFQI
jgi:GAF domain-containing protein